MQVKPHRQAPRTRTHAAFTLIEMLVVVIVIAILAGMVLSIASGIYGSQKPKSIECIEKVRACVEEFYTEYGQYPPVSDCYGGQPFGYEYPWTNGMDSASYGYVAPNELNPCSGTIFKFGLMSFLVTRFAGRADNVEPLYPNLFNPQWGPTYNSFVGDQPRDIRAMSRWQHYLFDPNITSEDKPPHSATFGSNTYAWTNKCLTVKDGWGHELHYKSAPPYSTYDIWSNGPDGVDGTSDDIHSSPTH